MRDFEELMVAIYANTIEADKLFVGDDVLMARLGLERPTFLRLRALLDRKGFLAFGPVKMEGLSQAGVEYVESTLL